MADNCELLFVIKDIPGKGKGLIATKSIMAGTLILFEDPLISIPKPVDEKKVLSKFNNLSESEQNNFLDLHDCGGEMKSIWQIFRTNSMQVCGFADLGVNDSAVYNSISRINHSCAPNAVWSWKAGNVRRQEVRACRDICEGEEIQCSYIRVGAFALRAERQKKLLNSWNFICTCEVCSKTGDTLDQDEEIRTEIRKRNVALWNIRMQKTDSDPGLIHQKLLLALTEAQLKLDMMMDIEADAVLALPAALIQCYQLSCKTGRNPYWYKCKAMELAEKLGDEYIKYCQDVYFWRLSHTN